MSKKPPTLIRICELCGNGFKPAMFMKKSTKNHCPKCIPPKKPLPRL